MKKILIIHSREGNLGEIAAGIAEGAARKGHQVEVLDTGDDRHILSFFAYDLVVVGSPTRGFFKGKIAPDIHPFLNKCKRTMGQEAVAFVTPRWFATTRALKILMGELEKLGCIVNNFASLKSRNEAAAFGEKL